MRTLIFDTRSRLAVNAGVLVGWVLLSGATLAVCTWALRRRDVRVAGAGGKAANPT